METTTRSDELTRRRQADAARRRAAEGIKSARERLTTGTSIKPEFQYELQSIFARNELSAAATMPALAVIFSLASMFWAPVVQGSLWLVLVLLGKVLLLEQCRRFLATPRAEINVRAWRRRFVATELLNGCIWAGFALVGLGGHTPVAGTAAFSSYVFLFATLIVVLAIRMPFASSIMPCLYAGTIPMTIAVICRLLLLNDPFYFALAAMAAGVQIHFLFLAKGLNSTALAMLELRAQKDTLIGEIEEQKSISDEARRRAETANKAKSRFLATMSHELRTPLNAILGFSEIMKSEILGPIGKPTYREYASNIYDSGRHLLNLINEILDLTRIEAGRYELHEEPLRLTDMAAECHRLLKLKSDSKGLEIVEEFAPNLPQVWADQRAIRQIFLNLLSNALKFTPKGGRITIAVAPDPHGGQQISIRDTGPGIPEGEIPKVLQAFGQGSLAHETAEGGTGLGLPIVQNLVELHGGSFTLKSELRKGTEAIVVLPKQRVLHPMPPLQPLGQERHREPEPLLVSATRQPRLKGAARENTGALGRP